MADTLAIAVFASRFPVPESGFHAALDLWHQALAGVSCAKLASLGQPPACIKTARYWAYGRADGATTTPWTREDNWHHGVRCIRFTDMKPYR